MRSLCVLAVLLCLVGLAAGSSVTYQMWSTSPTCEGDAAITVPGIPAGPCASAEGATSSVKYECSGDKVYQHSYPQANCGGTPTTQTYNNSVCTQQPGGAGSEKYTCGAAAQSLSALLLLALAFMAGKAKEAL